MICCFYQCKNIKSIPEVKVLDVDYEGFQEVNTVAFVYFAVDLPNIEAFLIAKKRLEDFGAILVEDIPAGP
jgi:hypothetical protein